MLTAILSLSQLRGAKLWLVFWLALAALYFALMLGVPPLRRKAGARNILLAFLAAEVFTDLVWAGVYGYHPVYRNYGIAAVYGLALWPVALAAAAAAALVWGKRNSSKKEKTPMWSEKNSLSLSRLAVLLFTGAVAVCDVSGWWLVNWFIRTSRYAGINDKRNIVLSMAIAGALSAGGAALYWLSGNTEFYWSTYQSLPATGFNGIPVALLAVNNPIGVVFTAIFMAMLDIVGQQLTGYTAYNEYITDVIISVIVYLSAFSLVIRMLLTSKRKAGATNVNAEPTPEEKSAQEQARQKGGEQA